MAGHRWGRFLAAAPVVVAAVVGCRRGPPGAEILATCRTSDLHILGVAVARTEAEWDALSPRLLGCVGPGRPVDFGRRMVVVVAAGNAGGYTGPAVVVDSVTRRGAATVVYAARSGPVLGCAAGARVTYPAVVLAAPATGGAVRLEAGWPPAVAWSECHTG